MIRDNIDYRNEKGMSRVESRFACQFDYNEQLAALSLQVIHYFLFFIFATICAQLYASVK